MSFIAVTHCGARRDGKKPSEKVSMATLCVKHHFSEAVCLARPESPPPKKKNKKKNTILESCGISDLLLTRPIILRANQMKEGREGVSKEEERKWNEGRKEERLLKLCLLTSAALYNQNETVPFY